MRLKYFFITIFLISFSVSKAQKSLYHTSEDNTFRKAMEMYEKEKYSTAQKLFQQVYEQHKDAEGELKTLSLYYVAQCAVNLFNADAEYYTMRFIEENPENPLVNEARFNLAGYFYTRKKWQEAIDVYLLTDYRKLSEEQQAEYYFKLGYSYFSKKDYEKARVAFYEITEKKTKYTAPALYFYSHIHYKEKNYQTALNGFIRLQDDENFGPIVPYYIAQIYYLQERYEDVIAFTPGIIDQVIEKRLAEVARITAESYYRLQMYEESIKYFRIYFEKAGSVSKSDKYQFAYAYYQIDSLEQAIERFEAVSGSEDLIGQNASYYLADCYLKAGDKQKALRAFSAASNSDFDLAVKQDALFNYAMLSFELESDPFNEAIRAFEEFVKLYPESKRVDDAYKFLVQSYLNARNYKQALASIEKLEVKSEDLERAYQRIAFNRGLELYINGKYHEAGELFIKSLNYSKYDKTLEARSRYWLAEAQFRLEVFDRAVDNYQAFKNTSGAYTLEEFDLVDYNLGYCYFKMEKYTSSVNWFRKFTGKAVEKLQKEKADAYNRLGDCYFIQADYYPAIDFYTRSYDLSQSDADYALLQKGLCEGLINRDQEKINTLHKLVTVYPNSVYADNALYESAQANLKLKKNEAAIQLLKKIETQYPNSELASKAMVQLGLLYYNADKNDEAIRYYKKTVTDYPGTEQANDALFGLKNIYIDLNRIDEYSTFVNNLGSDAQQLSATEEDSLTYISAEKIYMTGDCKRSTSAFERYIDKFPGGKFLLAAHFYKGDCNYRNKEFDKALVSFKYVLSHPRNLYTEQALLGAARIEYEDKKYQDAVTHYSDLKKYYSTPGNNLEADMAIMEAKYNLNQFEEAMVSAKLVENNSKAPKETKRKASYIIAKSYEAIGRDALAIEEYKKLSEEVSSKEGAEAKYRVVQLTYKGGDLVTAERIILEFSEMSTPHEYWIGKSFILWSEIFHKRGDDFQAIQTLQSLIDYYENSGDGIIEEAKKLKNQFVASQQANEKPVEEEDVEIDIID